MIWVIFYIFSALLFAAGGFMIWRGFPGVLRFGAGIFKRIAGCTVTLIGVLLILTALTIVDRAGSYNERRDASECRERLKEIYARISGYAKHHHGNLPESLREMADTGYLIERDLVCPSRESTKPNTEGDEADNTHYYEYRKVGGLGGNEVIVWDSEPHLVPHRIFKFLEKPRYNALRSDGEVVEIGKDELERSLGASTSP